MGLILINLQKCFQLLNPLFASCLMLNISLLDLSENKNFLSNFLKIAFNLKQLFQGTYNGSAVLNSHHCTKRAQGFTGIQAGFDYLKTELSVLD